MRDQHTEEVFIMPDSETQDDTKASMNNQYNKTYLNKDSMKVQGRKTATRQQKLSNAIMNKDLVFSELKMVGYYRQGDRLEFDIDTQ